MLVKNYIENNRKKNILVTKRNGGIVAILCDGNINFGGNDGKSILNATAKDIDIVRGVREDVYCIRL